MFRAKKVFITLMVFSSICILAGEATAAWQVGVAPATRKILPVTPMPEETSITLQSCRNEWEAFQVVIRSGSAISNINVTLSDLSGPDSELLPASKARLYREYYLNVTDESPGSEIGRASCRERV